MKIRVQFFSQLRVLAEASEIELEISETANVANLLDVLYTRTPALRVLDKNILVAADLEFVSRDHLLHPGDEISIMPPLQGG